MLRLGCLLLLLMASSAPALAGSHGAPSAKMHPPARQGVSAPAIPGARGASSAQGRAPAAQAGRPPGIPPGPKCMSDLELMAEAALAWLFTSETAARSCDPLLKTKDKRAERLMTRMHAEIVAKHELNFSKYQQAREKRFRRWYGEHWKNALEIDRRQAQLRYLRELRLGPGVCRHLRTDMEIALNSGWDYLRAKLSFEVEQRRPRTRMCR